MAVRLASDTIRTLYAIQCVTKDVKHQMQTSKPSSIEMCKMGTIRQISKKSTTDPSHGKTPPEMEDEASKQRRNFFIKRSSMSSDGALVHKVHPNDRPLRNIVPEREHCDELDDILAKWNVYKPKK